MGNKSKYQGFSLLLLVTAVFLMISPSFATVQEKGDDLTLFYYMSIVLWVVLIMAILTYLSSHFHLFIDLLKRKKELAETIISLKEEHSIAEANRQKINEFVATTHEIRAPLHGIISYATIGLDEYNDDDITRDELQEYFDVIHSSGSRLQDIISTIFDTNRDDYLQKPLALRNANIREIFNNALQEVKPLIEKKGIKLDIKETKAPIAKVDSKLLVQLFVNLLSNAIKFNTENGELRIVFSEDDIIEENKDAAPAVQISISDDGVGIPENELDLIFRKFVQSSFHDTHIQGTGLGLPICKEIVERHAGKIWAQNNKEGKGAMFVILLPVNPVIEEMQPKE